MGFCSNCGVPKANNVLRCWRCDKLDSNASGYKEYFEKVDRERKWEAEYIESLPAIKKLIHQSCIGSLLFFVLMVISCVSLWASILFLFAKSETIKSILGEFSGGCGLIIGFPFTLLLMFRIIRWSKEQ